ncbi:MAG: LysM peptidoglycan-binding domain-containing protein, partial [Smithellaceae bacterium]
NAELRYKITPNREYAMKIPEGSIEKFNLVYSDIPEAERPSISDSRPVSRSIKHRVRSGETVTSIARRYRVSRQTIFSANRINRKTGLRKGQIIRIPVSRAETAGVKQKPSGNNTNKTAVSSKTYKVKKGDTLFGIAKRFNVPVVKIKQMNNLKSNAIQSGRTLKIPSNHEVEGIS